MFSSVSAEGMPSQDLCVKRKLFEGVPASIKGELRTYMDDPSYNLHKFLNNLEIFRRSHLQMERSDRKVREIAEIEKVRKVEAAASTPPKQNDWIAELSAALSKEMAKSLAVSSESTVRAIEGHLKSREERPYKNPRQKFCGYCRSNEHNFYECPKGPPKQSCFDCWQVGHYKGNPICPKQA